MVRELCILRDQRTVPVEKRTNGRTTGDISSIIPCNHGIIPGIKVDKGVQALFGTDGETVTQGIDDLGKR